METTRKHKKIEWFIYLFLLPVLFAGILAAVILQVLGIHVGAELENFTRHTPVIQNLVPDPAKVNAEAQLKAQYTKQIAQLQDQVAKDKTNADSLQSQLDEKNSEILGLQNEVDQLDAQIKKNQTAANNLSAEVDMLTQMNPSKAADLLAAMPDAQVKQILHTMKTDVAASILQNMDSARAAQLLQAAN